jgi:hypothetical protein
MARPALLLLFLSLAAIVAGPAVSADQRRSLLIKHIKATSDCMARRAIESPDLVAAVKKDAWRPFLQKLVPLCAHEVHALIQLHDRFYGVGSGIKFFQGRYMDDLPRAIRARVQISIDRKLAEAAHNSKVAQQKTSEPRRSPKTARGTNSNSNALKTQESNGTAIVKEETPLQAARRRMVNFRARLYQCTDGRLAKLSHIERIKNLTELVLAGCKAEFEAALQSVVKVFQVDAGVANVDEFQKTMFRREVLKVVEDHIQRAAIGRPRSPSE